MQESLLRKARRKRWGRAAVPFVAVFASHTCSVPFLLFSNPFRPLSKTPHIYTHATLIKFLLKRRKGFENKTKHQTRSDNKF